MYLIINDQGGIISVKVTIVNVDDKKLVQDMINNLWGSLYIDKG
ncbi:transposase [Candidatus Enterovibrio escicola]|uniref:Mobile element protein n=1 Tax=Candidatus Enterovibrio escicola TaxID=1927127 RepID=A0A2A5T2M5_9GAMM|nr:Mobile element protein [Candidatus Enterovibrio escacola]